MLIPQLSVGTYVVVVKLNCLVVTPFVYLILWLAFLFVPWWYRCHILSIRRRDRCWEIEFVFVGYWFVFLVISCIHFSKEYYIVLQVLLIRDELVRMFNPSIAQQLDFVTCFCDLLVSMFFYDLNLFIVWMSLYVLCLVCNVFAWVFTGMSSFDDYFDYVILPCLSHSIKRLC